MTFNSFEFILCFLPLTTFFYFILNRFTPLYGKILLCLASMIFYAYGGIQIFIFLMISIVVNFCFVKISCKYQGKFKHIISVPIILNIIILFIFKYYNFTISNINSLFKLHFPLKNFVVPLGISFFSFQQISYLFTASKNELLNYSFLDYMLYILYFPKILMGPLIEPNDFLIQINDSNKKDLNIDNIACGIKLFSYGLFKKVMIADVFAKAVNWGFENINIATSLELLLVSLAYTFEIYFDFSGYSDMATGTSLMLNIELPINFDSPYKCLSIRDFWKRWHISLTKFFTKYIYIPFGGSKKGVVHTCINTIIVFFISGLWHGSNWTFILWGILHGFFMIIDRLFEKYVNYYYTRSQLGGFFSFNIVNILWLLFRSNSFSEWKKIVKKIFFLQDTSISIEFLRLFELPESSPIFGTLRLKYLYLHNIRGFWMFFFFLLAFIACLIPENNYKTAKKLTLPSIFLASILFVWGLLSLSNNVSFVYFNF